jgi:hypothetical protein
LHFWAAEGSPGTLSSVLFVLAEVQLSDSDFAMLAGSKLYSKCSPLCASERHHGSLDHLGPMLLSFLLDALRQNTNTIISHEQSPAGAPSLYSATDPQTSVLLRRKSWADSLSSLKGESSETQPITLTGQTLCCLPGYSKRLQGGDGDFTTSSKVFQLF